MNIHVPQGTLQRYMKRQTNEHPDSEQHICRSHKVLSRVEFESTTIRNISSSQ